ncbi:MAG: amidophosphoribosyltransferase [Deltaproteobacteria bacterium]|nr:amidophosphoribosyltransferase [Deltaproteobacteria bacterium]
MELIHPADDHPREACGVFGVMDHPEAARLTYFGLYALQHRGQESAGIATFHEGDILVHKNMGLVSEVFGPHSLKNLPGRTAIGQVRYSTTGGSVLANAQPFVVRHRKRSYAVAHNGNLVNARELRNELEASGSIFQTTMDTEIFLHLFVKNLDDGLDQALLRTVEKLKGAYSFVMLTSEGELVGIKDPHSFRPLCLGKLNGNYVLASETCALDLVGAEFVRELSAGEILIITADGTRSLHMPDPGRRSFCIFEFIYFARPDSNIFGHNVYTMRKAMGAHLAREMPVEADMVMPFPDSGNYAALGYSEASGIPFEMAMIRNHYVGRTFIQPSQSMRDFGVRVKLNPVKDLLRGKRVIVVEDSIIRGTTARIRVRALRDIGAKEVHMRVSCPPTKFPCPYGIDFSTRGELVAAQKDIPELTDFLGLDSLHYLSLPGLMDSTGSADPQNRFCAACFDGNYPVDFDEAGHSKTCLES